MTTVVSGGMVDVLREGPEANQSLPILLSANCGTDGSGPSNFVTGTQKCSDKDPWFTGHEQKQFHRVFIYKGPYKSYIGVCHSITETTAWVQLAANGSQVQVPLDHLWNLYVQNIALIQF